VDNQKLQEQCTEILRQLIYDYPFLIKHRQPFSPNDALNLVADLIEMIQSNSEISYEYQTNDWGK
jgi:hypothetical protein